MRTRGIHDRGETAPSAAPRRRALIERLVVIGLLVAVAALYGCPRCSPPIVVQLFDAATGMPVVQESAYRIFYSHEGGPFQVCDGTFCGEGNAGCGVGAAGRYRVRVELGAARWEGSAVVPENVCISGGETVEVHVAPPAKPEGDGGPGGARWCRGRGRRRWHPADRRRGARLFGNSGGPVLDEAGRVVGVLAPRARCARGMP